MTANESPKPSENQPEQQPENTVFELGVTMRERREKRGKELAEVADLLRIRRVYLEAIEEGRLDELPDGPYAVGFVRTYAKYLRMSEEKSVKSYKAYIGARGQQAELHFPVPSQEGGLPSRVMAVAGLFMLVGVYAIWTHIQGDGDKNIVSADSVTVTQTETKSTDGTTSSQDSGSESTSTQEKPVAETNTTDTTAQKQAETAKTEIAKTETAKTETAKTETAKTEATETETTTAEANTTETTPVEQTPTAEKPAETAVADNTTPQQNQTQATEIQPLAVLDVDKRYVSDLSLNSTGHVWVVIRHGENIVMERLLASGDMLNLTQYAGYTMDLGNAGVVSLNRNNENSQVLGQLGEVKEGLLLGSALNIYFE